MPWFAPLSESQTLWLKVFLIYDLIHQSQQHESIIRILTSCLAQHYESIILPAISFFSTEEMGLTVYVYLSEVLSLGS